MANTYTQIHLQVVFAVRYRRALIAPQWKVELYKYMTAIIQNNGHKLLAINGIEDHVHILIGFRTHQSLADLMSQVKGDSSRWINDRKLTSRRFRWQGGYGAFSYQRDLVPRVIRYILNQEEHHRQQSMRQEYIQLLETHQVEYDEAYIFDEVT